MARPGEEAEAEAEAETPIPEAAAAEPAQAAGRKGERVLWDGLSAEALQTLHCGCSARDWLLAAALLRDGLLRESALRSAVAASLADGSALHRPQTVAACREVLDLQPFVDSALLSMFVDAHLLN